METNGRESSMSTNELKKKISSYLEELNKEIERLNVKEENKNEWKTGAQSNNRE